MANKLLLQEGRSGEIVESRVIEIFIMGRRKCHLLFQFWKPHKNLQKIRKILCTANLTRYHMICDDD